jgi:hypothetical protein
MEPTSPLISVNFYHISWLHIPYNVTLQSHHFDTLTAHISWENDFNLHDKNIYQFNENFLYGISQNYKTNFKE